MTWGAGPAHYRAEKDGGTPGPSRKPLETENGREFISLFMLEPLFRDANVLSPYLGPERGLVLLRVEDVLKHCRRKVRRGDQLLIGEVGGTIISEEVLVVRDDFETALAGVEEDF